MLAAVGDRLVRKPILGSPPVRMLLEPHPMQLELLLPRRPNPFFFSVNVASSFVVFAYFPGALLLAAVVSCRRTALFGKASLRPIANSSFAAAVTSVFAGATPFFMAAVTTIT